MPESLNTWASSDVKIYEEFENVWNWWLENRDGSWLVEEGHSYFMSMLIWVNGSRLVMALLSLYVQRI